jgi:hypothetical protein
MNKEIENTIKKIALRDVEIALLKSKIKGSVIPDEVFNILKEVTKQYCPEVYTEKSTCCKEDVVEDFKSNPSDHHDPEPIYTCSKCKQECDAE